MYKFLIPFLITMMFVSCNSSEDQADKQNASDATPSANAIYLPSITMAELNILWEYCNQVDYIYYDLPFSTNLDDQYSIQQSLRHISETPVPLAVKNNCKPISRVFYKNSGEDLIEAEVYFSEGCTFFVFFKDGKPAFSNLMTETGVKHYSDVLQKAAGLQRKLQ